MARIRKIEISHFRGIEELMWLPRPGINCLIGPGDSCKSTILDAIDLCLGARRTAQFSDADFYCLDIMHPISITLTLGDLADNLKNFESYGQYLRGFNATDGTVEDESGAGLETVLSLNLRVEGDLEPVWSLVSDRATTLGVMRGLLWADRLAIAPTRIGVVSDYNLSWRKGSVLTRLANEKADASAALLQAARAARGSFADDAAEQLAETLGIVSDVASKLGIDIGETVRAELDAHSISMSGGTVSLHNEAGVPLRGLGIGSSRLLVAGLQHRAAATSPILLVDELEHGLEPHRIIRFLGSLGAKDESPALQVFMTSHSPVAVRELSVQQIAIVRRKGAIQEVLDAGQLPDLQGTVRAHPEAFLAKSVLVCEGASEVGLLRGIDQCLPRSMHADGTAFVDAGGFTKIMVRAEAMRKLGYQAATFRDDDYQPDEAEETAFIAQGGKVFKWRPGKKIEEELFDSLPPTAVSMLLNYALEDRLADEIDSQIRTQSSNTLTLEAVQTQLAAGEVSPEARAALGKASGGKKSPWFKSVSAMEYVGREIVFPHLKACDPAFFSTLKNIVAWSRRE